MRQRPAGHVDIHAHSHVFPMPAKGAIPASLPPSIGTVVPVGAPTPALDNTNESPTKSRPLQRSGETDETAETKTRSSRARMRLGETHETSATKLPRCGSPVRIPSSAPENRFVYLQFRFLPRLGAANLAHESLMACP